MSHSYGQRMVDADRDKFDVTAPGGVPTIRCRACGATKSEPWRAGILDAWAAAHDCGNNENGPQSED